MAIESEKQLHNFIKREAKARGVLCDKLESRSRRGWPDIILAYADRCVFCELKAPTGGVLGVLQARCIRDMQDHGLDVMVVGTVDQAVSILDYVAFGCEVARL